MKEKIQWGYGKETGRELKKIIAFMDDSSRFITCYGVFDSATIINNQSSQDGIQGIWNPRRNTGRSQNSIRCKEEIRLSTRLRSFLRRME